MNVMIAHSVAAAWVAGLSATLARLPVSIRMTRTADDAFVLATDGGLHLGVVDHGLPAEGGLAFVRRLRGVGLALPCLLVCEDPSPGVLRDALGLEVYSVLQADGCDSAVANLVTKIGSQVYGMTWPDAENLN